VAGTIDDRKQGFMAKITIIVGHSQRQTLCEGLGEAYRRGAQGAGHDVKMFVLSDMKFDPILHEGYRREQPLEPDLQAAYDALAASDHWVFLFPLWLGDMPAILKGFLERVLQPDLIHRKGTAKAMNWRIFENKSARLIMTMGMPVSIYRLWYRPHALKLFRHNILHFIGVKPVRETLFGMVADVSIDKRGGWLKEVEALGKEGA
jgi:putative NADPH-quinone reductase